MRVLAAIAISVISASLASAEVFVTVYRCDGKTALAPRDPNTPHAYLDIMVGTRLVLVVSSDEPEEGSNWWGGLQFTWDDWERGKLLGRGYDPNSLSGTYRGSCLPAAGIRAGDREPLATFVEYATFKRIGFELTTARGAVAGDWFILDYVAEQTGLCNVGFFDYAFSPEVPTKTLSFTHVSSRDFDGNGVVNFADFASLASHWRQPADPNAGAAGPCDLDADQLIGPSDLGMFSEYWLERADCTSPATEPNVPPAGP
jgi:hypothetical protein